MSFQFCSSFLIVFIRGADSSDPQALAVWNGVVAMFRVAACWGEILVCIGRFCMEVGVNGVVIQDDCGVKEQDSLH